MTASLSIRQVIEAGPKMPSTDPAARARTESRAASRSLSETKCAPLETNGDRFYSTSVHSIAIQQATALQTLSPCGISSRSEHGGLAFMFPLESVLFRSSEAPSAALSFRVSFSSIQVA